MTQNQQIKKAIFEIIERRTITRSSLLASLQAVYLFGDLTDRIMRKLIEQMVNEDGYLIASSGKGYNLITNSAQLLEAQKYLKNKAFPLFLRANKLHANFFKDSSPQLSIDEFMHKT